MKKIYQLFRAFIHKHPVTSTFLVSVLLSLVIECFNNRSIAGMGHFLLSSPHLFLLNVLIVWQSFTILLMVKRKWFFTAFLSLFWAGLGFIDFCLRSMRVTPFNFSDIRMIPDAIAVAEKYINLFTVILALAAFILVLFVLVKLYRLFPVSARFLHPVRGILSIAVSLLAVTGLSSLYISKGYINPQFGNLTDAYRDYGFVYCYYSSIVNTGIKKPESYSEESINQITEEKTLPESDVVTTVVSEDMDDENPAFLTGIEASADTPNIIFLQLESFSDPLLYEHMKISKDPIPYYHELMENYSSGFLSVPAVGAGTANTEFEVISGMNLDFFGPGEYPYRTVLQDSVCESICFNLKNLGYHAQAMHNNTGHFYDRYEVYEQLGFDIFTSLEYMDDYELTPLGWCKDKVLTKEILGALNATVGSDVLYTVSVQGHGSYPTEKLVEKPVYKVKGLPTEEEKNAMEYYIAQIHEMDDFVKELTDTLSDFSEPTILVMYGDHLPSLDLTADKLKNGDEFQTEYVIWDNMGLKRKTKDLEAYQLGAEVLNRIGISTGTMTCYHQAYLQEKKHTKKERNAYLEDMKNLEYDLLYGDQNVYKDGLPYERTDIQMGYKKISLNNITTIDKELYITGENFTSDSKVMVDGKVLAEETIFVSPHMLYVEEAPLKEGDNTIAVGQYAKANAVLSQTKEKVIIYTKP